MNKIDKTSWPLGEWSDEPDYVEWESKHGHKCEIKRRSPIGHLCGYVNLKTKSPLIGVDLSSSILCYIPVHGGITFTKDNAIGFDCGHAGDRLPRDPCYLEEEYKNIEYVKNECEDLSEKISELEKELMSICLRQGV